MSTPIYMDFASTTPLCDAALHAMMPYFQEDFYNPSALYLSAKKVKSNLEEARATAADLLQVRPAEIVFTAGSTEANNMVIHGVMQQFSGAHMVVSAIEHDSVMALASLYATSLLPVNQDGITQVNDLALYVTDETVLVSCMLANNEVGTLQPVAELAKQVQAIRSDRLARGVHTPLYVHTDAAQAFAYEKVLPHQLGVDFAVISGSKLYGPKQAAVLFVKQGHALTPLIVGGGQEFGMRSGTENVPYCIGLVAAMQEAVKRRTQEAERLTQLRTHCIEQLVTTFGAELNGSAKHRLPNNVHVYFKNIDNELLVMQLDEHGIMAAAGSACHASSDEPSHVLRAMGYSVERANSSVRFTFGRSTTEQHIQTLVTVLAKLLQAKAKAVY